MSRASIGTHTGVGRTLRPLLVAAVLLAAFFVAPVGASATPATAGSGISGPKPVASNIFTFKKETPDLSKMTPMRSTNVVSQFSCQYGYVPPGYSIDFHCTIFTGAIQIYLQCTDPRIAGFSPVMRAPGTYDLRAVCGPPAVWAFFQAVDA